MARLCRFTKAEYGLVSHAAADNSEQLGLCLWPFSQQGGSPVCLSPISTRLLHLYSLVYICFNPCFMCLMCGASKTVESPLYQAYRMESFLVSAT